MVDVIKRDGRREPFIQEKVAVSAMKAGAPVENARAISREMERVVHDGMSTQEIRGRVLELLHAKNPEWEQNWIVYDRAIKKRA